MGTQETQNGRGRSVTAFSPAAMAEASGYLASREQLFAGRERAQGITLGFGEQQGFWVEKIGDTRLVSISYPDVASVVPRGSALDQDAYRRVFTKGTATEITPLMPPVLKHQLFTFAEDQPRPAITVTIPLDKDLQPGEPEIRQTVFTNRRATNGATLAEALSDESHQEHAFYAQYRQLATDLLEKRRERGALAYYDTERGLATTTEGKLRRIRPGDEQVAELIRQEFLILAGQTVAEYLLDNEYPTLYRNHKAKPLAPTHESLQHDIAAAIALPESFDPESYERRRAAAMERPHYSPILEGHFGLNAVAYMEIGSPPDSYPALVGQRILTAFINDEEPPYSFAELTSMGQYIGTASESMAVAQRERVQRQDSGDVRTGEFRISMASDELFVRIIRGVVKEPMLRPDVADEILRRMREKRILAKDMFTLLAGPDATAEDWRRLHTEIVKWLVENPTDIRQIVQQGTIDAGWERDEPSRVFKSGTIHERVCSIKVSIVTPDGTFPSDPIHEHEPLLAKQYANLDALTKALGIEVPTVEQELVDGVAVAIPFIPASERHYTKRPDSEHNYRTDLGRIARDLGAGKVSYDITPHGQIHNTYFTGTVTVTVKGEQITSDVVMGRTEKDAQQSAAANVLPKVEAYKKQIEDERAQQRHKGKPVTVNKGDYKGGLVQLTARNRWGKPQIVNEDTGDGGFNITITILVPNGEPKVYKERVTGAESGKQASQIAASHMLTNVFSVGIVEK